MSSYVWLGMRVVDRVCVWASLYFHLVSVIAREFFVGQSRTSLDSWNMRKVCYQLEVIQCWCALIGVLLHLPGLVRSLKNDVGQLTGEKASLQREVEKLRAEVFSLPLSLSHLPSFSSPPYFPSQVLRMSHFLLSFSQNEELMRQLEALQNELAAKTKNLEQAE